MNLSKDLINEIIYHLETAFECYKEYGCSIKKDSVNYIIKILKEELNNDN